MCVGNQLQLVIKNDSTLRAWGDNTDGQLGNGTNTSSSTPITIPGMSSIKAISGGTAAYHSLALKADGTVWTWGRNTEGQLGQGNLTSLNTPTQVANLSGIVKIAGGEYHSLLLKNDGTVWSCGRNNEGQLGDGTTTNSSVPVQVQGLTDVIAIAGGRYFSIALKSDGTVWTWGQNNYGQLGNGTITTSTTPVQVANLANVVAITGSAFHGIALLNDGTLKTWGRNSDGQLGIGSTTNSSSAVAVSTLTNVVEIAAGTNYSLARTSDGTLYTWGRNPNGQLGDGTLTGRTSPGLVVGLCPTVSPAPFDRNISGGWSHTLYICNNGDALNAWGANAFSQVGNGGTTDVTTPVVVNNLTNIHAVTAGYQHTLALLNDSTVWAWGDNTDGQLGNGTNTSAIAPVLVNGLSHVIATSGGQAGYHSLALKADGTVWTWGRNSEGQLGDGTLTSRNTPTQVSNLTGVIAIAGGEYHSLAVKNDGTVWAWGRNNEGQLGNGTNVNSSVPVQVEGLTGFKNVAGGRYFSIALKNDSTVYTFGQNNYGQLGNGATVNSTLPVQVSNLTGVKAVTGAAFHCLAIVNDNSVKTWGRNSDGQLGNGTTVNSSTPVQVTGLSNVIEIAAGTNYSIAKKDNDSLFTWGRNPNGQLGDGTLNGKTLPGAVSNLCPTCVNTTSSLTISACDSYTVPSGNQTVTASGTYFDTISNTGGCDSLITINLTINTINNGATQAENVLTATQTGATYQWINCANNQAISGATTQTFTATANGTYAVIVTKNNCSDTSTCLTVNTIGLSELEGTSYVSVYPNPSKGLFYVQIANKEIVAENAVVYNLVGQKVDAHIETLNNQELVINLSSQPNGVYYMTIQVGEKVYNQKLIKN
jgi:alpha-tubulin suppressor-like RCC1 family protein